MRPNSWQPQWLHFATTNKRYAVIFSMFLQLPAYSKVKVLIFTAHAHCFKLKRNLKIPDIRAFFQLISGRKFYHRNAGHARDIGNPSWRQASCWKWQSSPLTIHALAQATSAMTSACRSARSFWSDSHKQPASSMSSAGVSWKEPLARCEQLPGFWLADSAAIIAVPHSFGDVCSQRDLRKWNYVAFEQSYRCCLKSCTKRVIRTLAINLTFSPLVDLGQRYWRPALPFYVGVNTVCVKRLR